MSEATGSDTTRDPSRSVIEVSGADAESFLQGLWSNDVTRAGADACVYAAMLTPQGKFLVDAFIWRPDPETFLLDAPASEVAGLVKKLALYKLRSAVEIRPREDLAVVVSSEPIDARDPRDLSLGFRALAPLENAPPADRRALMAYERRRVAAGAPSVGADLAPGDAFILEYDFERLGGVDFKKGCYVGQEVTARMRHKAELRRGLYKVRAYGVAPGVEVLSDDKPAGRLGSVVEGVGLALLRKDRLAGRLSADGVAIELIGPAGGAG